MGGENYRWVLKQSLASRYLRDGITSRRPSRQCATPALRRRPHCGYTVRTPGPPPQAPRGPKARQPAILRTSDVFRSPFKGCASAVRSRLESGRNGECVSPSHRGTRTARKALTAVRVTARRCEMAIQLIRGSSGRGSDRPERSESPEPSRGESVENNHGNGNELFLHVFVCAPGLPTLGQPIQPSSPAMCTPVHGASSSPGSPAAELIPFQFPSRPRAAPRSPGRRARR